ncbi:uncharacterized protein UTRI_10282 [Ustilago trichophora]|uniref:Uncharacterized protein n=1 Tax=Ustilago trichophora TaxID=86804 RepID=A0A5C3EKP1_9BASI|nr:uncharacterized protein UTRI_10282 [Ustilago trichophora]
MDKEKDNTLSGVPKLKSLDDYHAWKDDFTTAMMAKGKVWFCITEGNGPGTTAAASKNKEDWAEAEIKAQGFVLYAIGNDHKIIVKSLNSSKAMWDQIQEHFEQHISLCMGLIESELSNIKQHDNETIDQFATRIEKLCEQLGMTGKPVEVGRRMRALTQGLRPEFDMWKTIFQQENDAMFNSGKHKVTYKDEAGKELKLTPHIDVVDELERFRDALTNLRAREEEIKQQKTSQKQQTRHIAMSVQQQHHPNTNNQRRPNGNNNNRNTIRCTKCGRIGHATRVCGVKCNNCGIMGHYSNECSRLTSQPRSAPVRNDFNRRFNNNNNNTNNSNRNPTVNATARFVNAMSMDQNVNENINNQYQQNTDFQQQDMSRPITRGRALSARLINCDFTDDTMKGGIRSQQFRDSWILDSGASSHMTNRRDLFNKIDMKDTKMKIKTATGQTIDVKGVGEVDFIPIINGEQGEVVTFTDVLYAPKLDTNLISLTTLLNISDITFDKKNEDVVATIMQDNEVILQCRLEDNTMILNGDTTKMEHVFSTTVTHDALSNWHNCLGHASLKSVKEAIELTSGIKVPNMVKRIHCEICEAGKSTRKPFDTSETKSNVQLELIHSDVMGPFEESTEGYKYIVTLIDDFSRYTTVQGLVTKGEVPRVFRDYLQTMETRTGRQIRALQSDGGGEFVNQVLSDLMQRHGITHRKTVPYTPQQNGVAERMNRTLMDMVRCMLIQSGVPDHFWLHAIQHAAYVRNRLPNINTGKAKTPYELFYDKPTDISMIRPFGCAAWVHLLPHRRTSKLSPRSTKMIYLGTSLDRKAYELCDIEHTRLEQARDVNFIEDEFPSKPKQSRILVQETQPRRPRRIEENESEDEIDILALSSRTMTSNESPDPVTIQEAQSRTDWPQWEKAMQSELNSHKENGTWEVIDNNSSDMHLVTCKWVYKLKLKSDGTVDKYKARLVARGFKQWQGIDYEETFAPVLKFSTLRVLIAMATSLNLQIEQMDVVTAFLNGEITEDIYMSPPPGYWPGRVLKLKKALYGLKQAGRKWYEKLDSRLQQLGFSRLQSDFGVYKKGELPKTLCIIAVYVDDIVIVSSSRALLDSCKKDLASSFKMTEGGKLEFILGLEVLWGNAGTKLSQAAYIRRILGKFLPDMSKIATTPLPVSIPTGDFKRLNEEEHSTYRAIVGSLIYASTGSRPNISYATGKLSQEVDKPTTQSMKNAIHLLRYLKSTQMIGLNYLKDDTNSLTLEGYSDADFAGDTEDRKSTNGIVTTINGVPVNWFSKKQKIVADSTTVAEYIALTESVKDIIWTRQLLGELGLHQQGYTPIHIDNSAAKQLAADPKFHSRTKHIDVKFHFIREHVAAGEIKLFSVNTLDQRADCLTKSLGPNKVEESRRQLCLQ